MIINVVYEQCIIGMCRIQRMKKKELYLCLCAMALSKVVYLSTDNAANFGLYFGE